MEIEAQIAKDPVIETPIEKPVVKTDDFDSRFAALAKKERLIRDRESKFKSEFEPKMSEFNRLNGIKERAKQKDPYAIREALDYLGLSHDELNEVMLTHNPVQKDPEVLAIRQQLEEMKKERDRMLEEQSKRQVEENIKSFKSDIAKGMKADLEKYELCNLYDQDATDLAFQICEEHYNKTEGEMLPIDKALEKVEAYYEQMLSKVKNSKKLGFAANLENKKDPTQTVTLTNDSTSIVNASSETLSGLSGDERLRAILNKYKNKG